MTAINRRSFLAAAACAVTVSRLGAQSKAEVQVALSLSAPATGPKVPDDFVGLSYEVQQLADPNFFSTRNGGLIREFKALSSRGVLRLGGNTGEFAWWKPTPHSPEPAHLKTREVTGEPRPVYYAVTAEAVRNLAEFLQATGWTCLYGIGLATNTPERAAAEGEFVAKTLGQRLQYFQIGNEVDLFDLHLRDPKMWSAKTYVEEWLAMTRAISARVPEAKFGMPDVATKMVWLREIAAMWQSIENPPNVTTLTHHHYFSGPATNPEVNIPNLLKPATMAKVQAAADMATAAADSMGVRVRMTEGNTCYRGGKPGVSDVFAAALWAADYSLLLASNNYSGINLHGGTGSSVANSVGGSLPGDVMLKEEGETPQQIAGHPHPFYTPIATFGSEYVMEPVAYGLKFAGSFSGGVFLTAELTSKIQSAGVNATAYAVSLTGGNISVIVLNKDVEKDLSLTLDFGAAKISEVEIERLHAPALDSRAVLITRADQPGRVRNGKFTITVPRATGLRLTTTT